MVEVTTIIIFAVIFLIGIIIAYYLGKKLGCLQRDRYWEGELPNHRRDAIMKSRAVLGGHFTENLAPYLPDFPFLPTECRFVGKPTDFIVFRGMDDKKIDEVVFVEVKSGQARLSPQEKNLKETIEKKKVRFEEYRIPGELTKKGDIGDKIRGIVEGIKDESKKFFCETCGRPIKHRGKCMSCNIKAKRKRERR